MVAVRVSPRASLVLLLMIFFVLLYGIVEITGANSQWASVVNGITPDDDIAYGIIIDAGSTGSRLFLYHWRATSVEELIDIKPALDDHNNPVVKKVFPGLSTFAEKPNEAADYIKPLLGYAIEFVPEANRPYTPVFILATAGMRLVPPEQQKAILNDLHTRLPKMTPMQIMKEHIRVIEGKWEGIYSWISVNYVLGKFASSHSNPPQSSATELSSQTTKKPQRQATVGMIDMGGASVQIAFELPGSNTSRGENVDNVNLGCKDDDPSFKYTLYVTTFLGSGVNEGLRRYEQSLSDEMEVTNGTYIRDSCLPVNLNKEVLREDNTKFMRKGYGDWGECTNRLSEIVAPLTSKCADTCFFGNVTAPKINLSSVELFGFSEYWFSVEDVLGLGGAYNYTQVADSSKKFCSQRWSVIQQQSRRGLYPKAKDDRLQTQCFKSAWVNAVLHKGFGVSKQHNEFRSAYNIAGQEIQWALGAMIYHMRYYPLRLEQKQKAQEVLTHRHPVTSVQMTQLFAVLVIIAAVAYTAYLCTNRSLSTPGLRRNQSYWSYMMVPTEDARFKSPSSSFRNNPSMA